MRSLLVVLLLVGACHSKAAPTTPPPPAADTRPVEASLIVELVGQAFPDQVANGRIELSWGSPGVDATVIEELGLMGVTTMAEIEALIPADFAARGFPMDVTVASLVRTWLIIHDADRYFGQAWRESWSSNGPEDFAVEVDYGVDLDVLREHGVLED